MASELVALDRKDYDRYLRQAVVTGNDVPNPDHWCHSRYHGYDGGLPIWVWISLVFVVFATIAGASAIVVRTRTALRSFRSFQVTSAALEETLRRVADAEERLARAGESAARLDAAVARLRESRTRAGVLAAALGELRVPVARVRATMRGV
jgi:hypothetical protein